MEEVGTGTHCQNNISNPPALTHSRPARLHVHRISRYFIAQRQMTVRVWCLSLRAALRMEANKFLFPNVPSITITQPQSYQMGVIEGSICASTRMDPSFRMPDRPRIRLRLFQPDRNEWCCLAVSNRHTSLHTYIQATRYAMLALSEHGVWTPSKLSV